MRNRVGSGDCMRNQSATRGSVRRSGGRGEQGEGRGGEGQGRGGEEGKGGERGGEKRGRGQTEDNCNLTSACNFTIQWSMDAV